MPETYWVKLKNPSDSQIIIESLSGQAGVFEVRDQRSYLDQIFAILNAASLAAVGIAALMLFSAALLISTTIRLSAFSRRRELGIMRLVGASNFYIQLPFILEGVVAAAIGSVLAPTRRMMPSSRRRENAESRIVVEINNAALNSIKAAMPIAAKLAALRIAKIWSR